MNLILHIIIANSFLIWHSNSYVFIYFFSSTAHCIQHHSTIITSTLFGHICSHHQELTDANENAISQYTEYNIDTVGMILFDKQSDSIINNTKSFNFHGFLKFDQFQLDINRSNQLQIKYQLQLATTSIFLLVIETTKSSVYYLNDKFSITYDMPIIYPLCSERYISSPYKQHRFLNNYNTTSKHSIYIPIMSLTMNQSNDPNNTSTETLSISSLESTSSTNNDASTASMCSLQPSNVAFISSSSNAITLDTVQPTKTISISVTNIPTILHGVNLTKTPNFNATETPINQRHITFLTSTKFGQFQLEINRRNQLQINNNTNNIAEYRVKSTRTSICLLVNETTSLCNYFVVQTYLNQYTSTSSNATTLDTIQPTKTISVRTILHGSNTTKTHNVNLKLNRRQCLSDLKTSLPWQNVFTFILLFIIILRYIQITHKNINIFIFTILSIIKINKTQPIATVQSFGIEVASTWYGDGPTADIIVTLWFGSAIYECTLYPLREGRSYQCDSSTWFVISKTNPCSEYKMMIDNSDTADEVFISRMFVNMNDNTFYGIHGWCLYNYPDPSNWFYYWYANYYQYDYGCPSQVEETPMICIDNEDQCLPGKQIGYFNETIPNVNIVDAIWESGINTLVEPCTIAPTSATYSPTYSPTTYSPTYSPITYSPTHNPAVDGLTCNSSVNGQITHDNPIHYYQFILDFGNTYAYKIFLDTCGSTYDTAISFYDYSFKLLAYYDDIGPCGYQSQLTIHNIFSGTYFVGIGGYKDRYGSYNLQIHCTNLYITQQPTTQPTETPTLEPTVNPTTYPTMEPTLNPSIHPTIEPTVNPTSVPTIEPSFRPSTNPTLEPTIFPSFIPSSKTIQPSIKPTYSPTQLSVLKCNSSVNGQTTRTNPIVYYQFILDFGNNYAYEIFLDTCKSTYDTAISFYNNMFQLIAYDDGVGPCGYKSQLTVNKVYSNIYFVGIGGFEGNYGEYNLEIYCTNLNITHEPTVNPSQAPTYLPTPLSNSPTFNPTLEPTILPTKLPTDKPITYIPTLPTLQPSIRPTQQPTDPTYTPTINPTVEPSQPTINPTLVPTPHPTININTVEFKQVVTCSGIFIGETNRTIHNIFYQFKLVTNDKFGYSVLFSSCGSSYDTAITLLDTNMQQIQYYDGTGKCGYQSELLINEIYDGSYILMIGGHKNSYGIYRINITCNNTYLTKHPTQYPTEKCHEGRHMENGTKVMKKINADDGNVNDQFGYSVSISNKYSLIGAYYDDDKELNSGSAYIFELNNDDWIQAAKLVSDNG
eukprot:109041_1